MKELEENGFEEEATNLADAIETEASPDQILSDNKVISEMDGIIGGVLYLSPQSINDIKNSLEGIIKSA